MLCQKKVSTFQEHLVHNKNTNAHEVETPVTIYGL